MMTWLDPRVWLFVLAIAAATYGAGRWQQHRADQLAHQAQQLEAVQAAREEEQRRTAAQQEIANDATKKAERARADARAAAAVSERLRRQLAEIVARNPPAAAAGTPAGDAIGVLADVLERIDRRAAELAEYADAARIAGQACERSYEALR